MIANNPLVVDINTQLEFTEENLQTYKDVRLVGAPPSSMGKFGKDTDNWVWPRHTCDFSVFRIYAGKDNEPASISEGNVPYVAPRSLEINLKGLEKDETMGSK